MNPLSSSWAVLAVSCFLFYILAADSINPKPDELHRFKIESRKQVKALQRNVCIKRQANSTKELIERLQCIEHHAPAGTLRHMHAIWEDVVGGTYPASDHEWLQFICATRSFQLKKNLMDVAFLLDSRVMESSSATDVKPYDSCPHMNETLDMLTAIRSTGSWDKDQESIASLAASFAKLIHSVSGKKLIKSSGIIGNEDLFNEPVDRCDMAAFNETDVYCIQRREQTFNMTQICKHHNAIFIKAMVQSHRCLERLPGYRMRSQLKSCWKLVTSEDFPKDDQGFVNFTCNHRYPVAIRRIIDNCYYERMTGRYISSSPTRDVFRQKEANLTRLENERLCAIKVWRTSDVLMTAVYRTRYNKYRSRYQRQETCILHDRRMIKLVIEDVRCPEYHLDREMLIVLKFCWKIAAGRDYPDSQSEWLDVLCSSSKRQLRSIEAKINPCIRAGPSVIFGKNYTGSLARQVDQMFEKQLSPCSDMIPFSERDIELEGA